MMEYPDPNNHLQVIPMKTSFTKLPILWRKRNQ